MTAVSNCWQLKQSIDHAVQADWCLMKLQQDMGSCWRSSQLCFATSACCILAGNNVLKLLLGRIVAVTTCIIWHDDGQAAIFFENQCGKQRIVALWFCFWPLGFMVEFHQSC